MGFRGGMGQGDSLHQQSSGIRKLGTGVRIYELPLLPYERQLIETLGCTEQEYRRFAYLAAKRGALRPAEYAHIPHIVNEPVSSTAFLTQLAIGLVLTAGAALLAPKPKQPTEIEKVKTASRIGQTEFSPTFGFDTQATLADYSSPIPIIFGRYINGTGGIVASPKLVWSRAFSLGFQQMVKQLFVVGEQGKIGSTTGIAVPDLNGIFLGNAALDAIYEHEFAFYWKKNSVGFTRVKATNLAYGTRGTSSSGDTENNNDIFQCPTRAADIDEGFCSTHSPNAQTQFGVYSAIANGTNYRVNWRIVSIPELDNAEDDPREGLITERIKIAGDYGLKDVDVIRSQGQRGVGRNYGRNMGVISLNGVGVNDSVSSPSPTEVREVSVGDTIVFSIVPEILPSDTYQRQNRLIVKVDDINSATKSFRRAADDQLQVGETIMIGSTVWVVQSRSIDRWRSDEESDGNKTSGQRQNITLKCVEVFGNGDQASIGLISERMLHRNIYNDDNGQTNANDGKGMSGGIGFYPLTKVSFGVVRNTRACDVTEIGLKSQVWNKLNGICNFAEIPSGRDLIEAEADQISYETGTQSAFIPRSSLFTLFIRLAGTDENGTEFNWHSIGEHFCVTGETPQDVYNTIRIKHPDRRQFEFKFVPRTGAYVARSVPANEEVIRLNHKTGQRVTRSFTLPISSRDFVISAIGEEVAVGELRVNEEMATAPGITSVTPTSTFVPKEIALATYLPTRGAPRSRVTNVEFSSWLPSGVSRGRKPSTLNQIFGRLPRFIGDRGQNTLERDVGNNRRIKIRFFGFCESHFPNDHDLYPGQFAWQLERLEVVSSSDGFVPEAVFNFEIAFSNNSAANTVGLTSGGMVLRVTGTENEGRFGGRQSGYEHEVFGDADRQNLGETEKKTFTITKGNKTIGIKLKGTVVRRDNETGDYFGEDNAWQEVTYSVESLLTDGNWELGETFDHVIDIGTRNQNPYVDDSTTFVGARYKITRLVESKNPPGFNSERLFEGTTQIADLSAYGDLVQRSNDSAPEHEILFCNESVENESVPQYDGLTLAGLALKSGRNFRSLDQLRVWLADGIEVTRLSDGGHGPSNKFTDLVNYLLTDKVAGAGNTVSSQLINTADLESTGKFLESNKLFFNGAISQPVNLRQFVSDTAPFFLCNFVISDGKFSLLPALPVDTNGNITEQPIKIDALFTQGNIIEDTYAIEYLSAEERKDFQAVMRYRQERRNQLSEEKTLVVRRSSPGSADHPIESFDLTQFCTSREHAFLVAKYFLTLRNRVTHTVKFRTNPFGISLAPGSFIRVVTEASPYQAANNGSIAADGTVTSATELADGTYSIVFYQALDDQVTEGTMTIAGGKVVEPALHGSLFSITSSSISSNTYMIEQLTLGEDGMVDVVATEFPTTSSYNSLMATDVLSTSGYITEG